MYILSVVLYAIPIKQNISSAKKRVKLGEGPSCGHAQHALQGHGLWGGRRRGRGCGQSWCGSKTEMENGPVMVAVCAARRVEAGVCLTCGLRDGRRYERG